MEYICFFLFSPLGIIFLGLGLYAGPFSIIRCKEKVVATCIGHKMLRTDGPNLYMIYFSYTYNNVQYEEKSVQYVSTLVDVEKEYPIGEKIEIYIDPHMPRLCRINKRVESASIFAMFAGLIIIILSVWMLTVPITIG